MRKLPIVALLLVLTAGCQKAPAQSAGQGQSPAGSQTPAAQPASQSAPGQSAPAPNTPPAAAPQAGQTPQAVKPVPPQLPEVLARVNGEAIGRAEFEQALNNVQARAGGPIPQAERDRVYRGILDQLVSFRLLLQESRARNISVSDTEVAARIEELKKQFPSEDEFKKALSTRKMSMDALRTETRSEMAVARLVEAEVKPKVSVQESDVKDFYDKNPDQFKQPESYRASHILIKVDASATEPQKKEAQARIADVAAKLKAGGDFAALAREFSQDGSAKNGGDLNYFRKGQMVPAFQKAVDALKVGEVSGIVESQFGYHIIKLTDKRPARTVPLPEVSQRIGQFLAMRAQQEKAGEFLQTLRAKSKVEILM